MQDTGKGVKRKRRWSLPSNLLLANSQLKLEKEFRQLVDRGTLSETTLKKGRGHANRELGDKARKMGTVNDGANEDEPARVGGDKRGGGIAASSQRRLRRWPSSADVGMVTDGC